MKQGLHFGKMKDGAGVAKNQLLHRLFFTSSPWNADFCKQKKSTDSKTDLQICCTADITLLRLGDAA